MGGGLNDEGGDNGGNGADVLLGVTSFDIVGVVTVIANGLDFLTGDDPAGRPKRLVGVSVESIKIVEPLEASLACGL